MIFNMVGCAGSGESLLVSDTIDANGGTIRTITGKVVKLQTKTITPTSSAQTVNPDSGYDGFSQVTVEAGGSSTPTIQTLSVTPSESEQTFNSSNVDGYKPVTVGAISSTYVGSGITRRNSEDITNEDNLVFTIPAGYYSEDASCWPSDAVLSWDDPYVDSYNNIRVSVRATTSGYISGVESDTFTLPDYVGSNITRRSSTDLTASGATVTVPAGYYASQATKSVTTMTLPTAAASSATSGYTSKATIGRSTSAQYINIPPGYNSAGAYYVISAVANGSASAPSTISGTSATVSTGTNTLTLTKTVSVTPTVSAGYVLSGTATNSSVSLTASVTTKAAATITPGTTNQTIAAGTYLTGAQTIAGDANLVASNIVSGVQIFGVTGNVVLQNVYHGSSAPSSSTGSNGDIYIQS